MCKRMRRDWDNKPPPLFVVYFFRYLVTLVCNWVGISSVDPYSILDHFSQSGFLTCVSKSQLSILYLIWFSCVCCYIWKERNNRIFNNKEELIQHLLDKIKHFSYQWLKAKKINYCFWLPRLVVEFPFIRLGPP